MPSLKALKNRIASVKSTQKITKAMKMVAAAKLRRAQERAEAARPYASRMAGVIAGLAQRTAGSGQAPRLIAGTGRDQRHLLVVLTSERGLAGAFNTNIIRLARRRADELAGQGRQVAIVTVGRKARTAFQRTHRSEMVHHVDLAGIKTVDFALAKTIADELLARFKGGEFDVATLFYARFRSALTQEPTAQRLIPVELPETDTGAVSVVVEYEPSEEAILETLLPRNIAVQILGGLLENAASEEGARMTAMDAATRNAGEMIGRLTLTYNRTRQAAITKELIEIISGAEAL